MSTFSTLRKAVVVETPQGLPDAPKQLDVLHVESGFRMAPETLYGWMRSWESAEPKAPNRVIYPIGPSSYPVG